MRKPRQSVQPQRYEGRKEWKPRPWLGRSVRVGVAVAPTLMAVLTTVALGRSFYDGSWGVAAKVGWFVVMLVVAAFVTSATRRVVETFLPLAALCHANVAFPEEAPSRLRTSLRIGSTSNRAKVIQEFHTNGLAANPQQAAEQVLSLVEALNRHDRRTRGHSERVRALADVIGEEMGLSDDERNRLRWGAMLHDVGKLAVPPEVLNKPGRPEPDEWEQIKSHPAAGEWRLAPLVPWLGEWIRCAWEHHERVDGSGYPRGLTGAQMALGSRIVAVADAFEVMTAARSYKKPLTYENARAELVRSSGTHFDPTVVRAFLRVGQHRTNLATGVFSSWVSQLSAGNSPLSAVARTVTEGNALGTVAEGVRMKVGAVLTATAQGATAIAIATSPITPAVLSAHPKKPERLAMTLPAPEATTTTSAFGASTTILAINDSLIVEPTSTVADPVVPPSTPEPLPEIPVAPMDNVDVATATVVPDPSVDVLPSVPVSVGDPTAVGAAPATGPEGLLDGTSDVLITPTSARPATTTARPPTTTRPATATRPAAARQAATTTTRRPAGTTTSTSSTTTSTSTSSSTSTSTSSSTSTSTSTTLEPTTTSTTTTTTTTVAPPFVSVVSIAPPVTTGPTTPDTTTTTPDTTTTLPATTTTLPACPGEWQATYFNSLDLSGPSALQRCEAAVTHRWLSSSPDPAVSPNFSARYAATLAFPGGVTTFDLVYDDGVRVFIDGNLLINDWNVALTGTRVASQSTNLTAGNHDVVVEFFDDGDWAVLRLGVRSGALNSPPITPPALGVIETWAAFGNGSGSGRLNLGSTSIRNIAVAPDGTMYLAETNSHRIRRVGPTGAVVTVAGTGTSGSSGDGGPATSAKLNAPQGIAYSPLNNSLYIGDTGNHRVRRVDLATGIITTVAGTGSAGFTGDGGPATSARLNQPNEVVVTASGDIVINDRGNDRVRLVSAASGIITTVAGGGFGPSYTGTSSLAWNLPEIEEVAIDPADNTLYVAETSTRRVIAFLPSEGRGYIILGAGSLSGAGVFGEGASSNSPVGLAVLPSGDLLITDQGAHVLRQWSKSTGQIWVVAGQQNVAGTAGDGGPAAAAQLDGPEDLQILGGDIYVLEQDSERIRRIMPVS